MAGKFNLTYFSPKIEKRKSAIDGPGLFAREGISSGEVVVVKGGYVLTRAQRDQVSILLGPSEIQITNDLFIGPTTRREREGGMMHLNHSCRTDRHALRSAPAVLPCARAAAHRRPYRHVGPP